MIRIFYAHASGDDSNVIAQGCLGIQQFVQAKGEKAGKDVKVTVIPGRDDFRAHCRGDWDVWAKSIVHREHAMTRKPFYDFIVIPTPYVGRATAQIVNVAIRAGRPVFLLSDNSEGNSSLERITQVYPYDVDDWQGGYRCEKEQPNVEKTDD